MQLFKGLRVGSNATVEPTEDRLRALRLVFLLRVDFLDESLPPCSSTDPKDPKLELESCPLNDDEKDAYSKLSSFCSSGFRS